jgi:hypothetical protein
MADTDVGERPVRGGLLLAAFGALALAVVVGVVAVALLTDSASTRTFVIEAGTGARLDAGEAVELMPTEVRMSVGDTLVLRNDDDRTYMVGPYTVRPGETVEQTFHRPQTLVGACQLSGSGEVRIVVV